MHDRALPEPEKTPAMPTWLHLPLPVWQSLIAAFVTLVLAWLQVRTMTVVTEVEKVTKDTHTLVNSNQGTQLKLHAGTAKRLAIISRDPIDLEISEQADAAVRDHDKAQRKVDTQNLKEK